MTKNLGEILAADVVRYTNRDRVRAAIINTNKIQQPEGYWKNLVSSRVKATSTGSYYDLNFEEVEDLISNALWEAYEHPTVMEGTVAFSANLVGFENVVRLSELDPGKKGILVDPKATGKLEFQLAMPYEAKMTDLSVIILGQHEGMEIVYTFHPGEPISPSVVRTDPTLIGKAVTVKEAMALGLTHAKLIKRASAGECGFCKSEETKVEHWDGPDACCWYTVKLCASCGRKELL